MEETIINTTNGNYDITYDINDENSTVIWTIAVDDTPLLTNQTKDLNKAIEEVTKVTIPDEQL